MNDRKDVPLITTVTGWFSRVSMAASQFFVIRIITHNYSANEYSVFAVLTGIVGWSLLADFGVGYSLQNAISKQKSRRLQSSPYIRFARKIIFPLAFLEILVLYFTFPVLSSFILQPFGFLSHTEKGLYYFSFMLLIVLTSLGGVGYRIWFGQGKGYIANIAQGIGWALALGGAYLIAKYFRSGGIFPLLITYTLPACLISIISYLVASFNLNQDRADMVQQVSFEDQKDFVQNGLKFLVIKTLAMGAVQTDYIIMAQRLLPTEIAEYAIITKIFTFLYFLSTSMTQALWPHFAEIIHRHDVATLNSQFRYYMIRTLGATFLASGALVALIPVLVSFLSGTINIQISWVFLLILVMLTMTRVGTDMYAIILQGSSDLNYFIVWIGIQMVFSVILQWNLAGTYGINGISGGILIAYLLTVAWAFPVRYRQLKKELSARVRH